MSGVSDSEEVFLPPLRQEPGFEEILDCLKRLRVEQPVWNLNVTREQILKADAASAFHRREALSYLSAVVKNSLSWIDNEDQQERIWNEASKRLAERCGRAAVGEILRRWPFQGPGYAPFDLTIREPSLTGDALGLKTWGSSYVLANLLHRFASDSLSHLFPHPGSLESMEVLELGSGTGLLGLAASCIFQTRVTLTDLPGITPNLAHNVQLNQGIIKSLGGSVDVAAYTWGGSEEENDVRFKEVNQYKLVLAADGVYDDDHPELLASAIDAQMSLDSDARALVMAPLRDKITRGLLYEFKETMINRREPLVCSQEGTILGQDDWGEDHDSHQVECWWGVFQRPMESAES